MAAMQPTPRPDNRAFRQALKNHVTPSIFVVCSLGKVVPSSLPRSDNGDWCGGRIGTGCGGIMVLPLTLTQLHLGECVDASRSYMVRKALQVMLKGVMDQT